MDICLLCDEPMHDKPEHGIDLDKSIKYKHKEHIIQNAIGGRLKSSKILCESCGGILNDEIDIEFSKLFLLISARINNFAKERNANANTRLRGMHAESNKEVRYVNKIPVPNKPSFNVNDEEKKVTIYCPKENIDNYRKAVLKQLVAENKQDFNIVEITEFSESDSVWLSFSKDVVKFNDKWKMGFIKIATEFAYLHGVPKNQLTKTLDQKEKSLIFSDNLYPFIPVTAIDHVLEYNRNLIERNYPTHTLYLYTQAYDENNKQLLCYIDLFSTFQYYILLNDNYVGPDILEIYSQKNLVEEKADRNFRGLQLEDLMIEANCLGIDVKDVPTGSMDNIYTYFEKEYAKIQPTYVLDFSSELSASLDVVNMALLKAMVTKFNFVATDENSELINFLTNFSLQDRIKLLEEIQDFSNGEGGIFLERYRMKYPILTSEGERAAMSMVGKCLQITKEKAEDMNEYGHIKFDFLGYYLNVQQHS